MRFDWLSAFRRRHKRQRFSFAETECLEQRVLLSIEPLTLIDSSLFGDTGTAASSAPSMSADGQRIVFVSAANNLVPGDTNGAEDVFLYDRGPGRVSLVSSNADNTGPADLGAGDATISADGRYVVFVSNSANLVFPSVNHGVIALRRNNVYVHDLVTRETTLVSRNLAGNNDGNNNSHSPSISTDGRFVAFVSAASDLIAGDTNNTSDVFVRDLDDETATLVSRATGAAGALGNFGATAASISGNGQFVVFASEADNLDPRDSNTASDLFIRNLQDDTTKLVTADLNNQFSANSGDSRITQQSISSNGRYVVFQSTATNLVTQNTAGQTNAFIRDTQTDTTRMLSINAGGTGGSNGFNAIITPSGEYAVFVSQAGTLTSDVPDTNGRFDVYRSTITPTTITNRLVSVNSAGTNGGNGNVVTDQTPSHRTVQISPDGRFVAFTSIASDLDAAVTDSNGVNDVFVRDMQANVTRTISIAVGGSTTGSGAADTPVISNDGAFVAFADLAANLILNDNNNAQDVFLRDLSFGSMEVVSEQTPLLPIEQIAPSSSVIRDVSADGRFVAYYTGDARKIVPSIAFSLTPALIVLDRETGEAQVADVLPNGTNSSNGSAPYVAKLNADGRFIVFTSTHNGLDGKVTGTNGGVYIRDLLTGVTRMVSRNSTTGVPANRFSGGMQVAISPDGRYVAFTSDATNLVDGVTINFFSGGYGNLYLWDRETSEVRIVSRNAAGNMSGNGDIPLSDYNPQFSADGSTLVYISSSSDLVAGITDSNNAFDVFAYDISTDTNSLISVSTTPGVAGNAASANDDRPQFRVSSDGQFVYFRSAATNLTTLNSFNRQQIYVRDLVNNTTQMVSLNLAGTAGGNNHSHTPVLSADGTRLLFQSTATDLSPIFHGTGGVTQVYVRDLETNTNELVSINAAGTAGGNHHSGNLVGLSDDPQAKLSADGRYVAFHSRATNLVDGYTPGNVGLTDLFLRDLETDTTVLVTYDYSGILSSNISQSDSRFRLVGNTVIFDTNADNISIIDRNRSTFSSPTDVYAFTYVGAARISGRVFEDVDGNQVQNGNEAGIGFWTVFIDANSNRRFDEGEERVFTNLDGDYRFTNLAAGTYSVGVVFDDGFVPTTPIAPFFYTVTLDSNTDSETDRNFGAKLALADLAVGEVTAPAGARSGSEMTVSWLVRNIAGTAASGEWQDAIYLSTDETLDAADTLLSTKPHTGGLGAFTVYRESTSVTLPAELPGTYFVLVQTDRRHQVPNETNRANNVVAAQPTELTVPTLGLNTATPDSFTAPAQNRYFQFTVAEGETLALTLDSAAAAGVTELYVSRFHLPTTSDFDQSALPAQPDQKLTIPTTGSGTYYVLARGASGAAADANFTLTAATVGFGLQSISPSVGGNSGRVTVEVRGTQFTHNTQLRLESGATTISAASIDFRDATLVYATFDLTGQAGGVYDLVALDGATSVSRADAFTVALRPQQPDPIQITLTSPGNIRNGRQSSVLVEYFNNGAIDVPAPLLQLTATNAILRLEDQPNFSGDFDESSIRFVGIAADGPAGILRPGQRGSVRIYLRTIGGEAGIDIEMEVNRIASDTNIDWSALKADMRPDFVPADAWEAIFGNFVDEVGTTTGELNAVLAENASYLSNLGVYNPDFDRLIGFEIQQASSLQPQGTVAESLDLAFPAPGLPLAFRRGAIQSIAGRYRLGPMGRGWAHSWEISAVTDPAGNVRIDAAGGSRFFTLTFDGRYLGSPGDFATLTATNGVYELTELDGSRTVFRVDGKIDFIEDTHGNRITATYDGTGRLTGLTHTNGDSLLIDYNAAGRISEVTDPAGRTVVYVYDAAGHHLLRATGAEGTTQYDYLSGQGAAREHALARVTDPNANHVFYDYDVQGRLIEQHVDDNAESINFEYNDAAEITITNAVNGHTRIFLNDRGLVERLIDSLGDQVDFDFDRNMNLTQLLTTDGSAHSYDYDSRGNLIHEINPLGHETHYTYTLQFNQLSTFRDARNNTTEYDYSAQGDLLDITYADGSQLHYTYDSVGNLIGAVNRRGSETEFTYDARGLVVREDFADGTHATYTYDAGGNLLIAEDELGATEMEYDSTDGLTRISYPDGRFLDFQYDAAGRRTRSVDQDGSTVNYAYDSVGHISELTDGTGARIVSYTYDAAGRLERKEMGNATFTTYSYDTADQLLSLVNHAPNGSVNSFFDYTLDSAGRRTSVTTELETTYFDYDALGQVSSVVLPSGRTIEYLYDDAGNRELVIDGGISTAYVANNLNQYVSVGSTSYTYDADGNRLSQINPDGTTAYLWNDQNQLIAIVDANNLYSYEYNIFGNRVAATRDGQRTEYLFDPTGLGNIAGEYSAADGTRAYVYGADLVSQSDAGGTYFYDYDAIGSTTGITDAAGEYINRYTTLPFGESLTLAMGTDNPFLFVGESGVSTDESGLTWMRARYYDPRTGQFLSEDPIGLSGGDPNVRRYVGNQPTMLSDPAGLGVGVDAAIKYIVNLHDGNRYLAERFKDPVAPNKYVAKVINMIMRDDFHAYRRAAKAAESNALKRALERGATARGLTAR